MMKMDGKVDSCLPKKILNFKKKQEDEGRKTKPLRIGNIENQYRNQIKKFRN